MCATISLYSKYKHSFFPLIEDPVVTDTPFPFTLCECKGTFLTVIKKNLFTWSTYWTFFS